MSDTNPVLPTEIETLKKRATALGIAFSANIGLETLRERIRSKLEDTEDALATTAAPKGETLVQVKQRLRREMSELIRVSITCMNPSKREWPGEVITVSNGFVGTFKKFIDFNAPEGYHVPRMILNTLKERKCQIFYTVKDSRGNRIPRAKDINEFAIEVLPALTQEDLDELAKSQLARNAIGDDE